VSREKGKFGNFLIGTSLLSAGLGFIVVVAIFGSILVNLFYHTSYRFVSIFLLLILLSNILARIALVYVKQ